MTTMHAQCLCGAIYRRKPRVRGWRTAIAASASARMALPTSPGSGGAPTPAHSSIANTNRVSMLRRLRPKRGFCARCGSSLLFRSQRWPGELHLTAANQTSTPDRTLQAHMLWDTHVTWASIGGDGLPRKSAAEVG